MLKSDAEEGREFFLVQLAADNAQLARIGGRSFVHVGLAGVVVEVQPCAVFAGNYALCAEHDAVFHCVGEL